MCICPHRLPKDGAEPCRDNEAFPRYRICSPARDSRPAWPHSRRQEHVVAGSARRALPKAREDRPQDHGVAGRLHPRLDRTPWALTRWRNAATAPASRPVARYTLQRPRGREGHRRDTGHGPELAQAGGWSRWTGIYPTIIRGVDLIAFFGRVKQAPAGSRAAPVAFIASAAKRPSAPPSMRWSFCPTWPKLGFHPGALSRIVRRWMNRRVAAGAAL